MRNMIRNKLLGFISCKNNIKDEIEGKKYSITQTKSCKAGQSRYIVAVQCRAKHFQSGLVLDQNKQPK